MKSLQIVVLLSIIISLASCGHEHNKTEKWRAKRLDDNTIHVLHFPEGYLTLDTIMYTVEARSGNNGGRKVRKQRRYVLMNKVSKKNKRASQRSK